MYYHSTAVLILTRLIKNTGHSTLDNMFDITVYLVGKAIWLNKISLMVYHTSYHKDISLHCKHTENQNFSSPGPDRTKLCNASLFIKQWRMENYFILCTFKLLLNWEKNSIIHLLTISFFFYTSGAVEITVFVEWSVKWVWNDPWISIKWSLINEPMIHNDQMKHNAT